MRRSIFLWLTLLLLCGCLDAATLAAQTVTDSCWSEAVKTATLYKNGVELESPVLVLGGQDRLLLRFDVLDAEVGSYRYKIRHCDKDWRLDDMEPYEYINGFEEGPIDNYANSFTTLTDYVD